jgi:uncharacterized protein YceH (UPF0502 family)
LEKQRATPDAYPLSVNALRLACNQATNRDPVVEYDETTVVEALRRTAQRGWTRLASGAGSRARKYRHLLDDALGLSDPELSLLAVLLLRGPQTPGELKQRSERLHPFADLATVLETLERLVERGYAERLERRPGQKEDRYRHLLGGEQPQGPGSQSDAVGAGDEDIEAEAVRRDGAPGAPDDDVEPGSQSDRLDRLEGELAELRRQVRGLREALGE